jgi:hypothetical protein
MERAAWTDERLDDLVKGMDAGFDRVDRDLRDLRGEMERRFTVVDQRFTGMEGRFTGIEARFSGIEGRFTGIEARFTDVEQRFNSLDTTVRWFGGSMIVGLIATFAAVVVGS